MRKRLHHLPEPPGKPPITCIHDNTHTHTHKDQFTTSMIISLQTFSWEGKKYQQASTNDIHGEIRYFITKHDQSSRMWEFKQVCVFVTCAIPIENALGESRQRSQTSGCGKSFISTVKSDRQPNTTVSMEPTVLANLGFLNNGVSMKEKKICEAREKDNKRGEQRMAERDGT